MKMKFILTVTILLGAASFACADTNDMASFLQRGLFEEEANHQLEAAIANYKGAIEHFDHERQLAATAIFRLGECYRKVGKTNEANAQYERIVREFSDQTQLAQLSRACLPSSGGVIVAGAGSPAEASPLPSDEEKFLLYVKQSAQNSPDLVNQQLSAAAQAGYVSAAAFLLEHGADVNLRSIIGTAASQGNEAMVQLLLSHGADVNGRNNKGPTALCMAAEDGYITVCRTLLDHGADVNLDKPILGAVRKGKDAIVQLLLSRGADVNSTDHDEKTLLSLAVDEGSMPLCQMLVAHGANVNAKDKVGWAPLHVAALRGNRPLAEFLITNRAEIDAKSNDGSTPLHIAAEHGSLSVAEFLITNKAQINGKNTYGQTPLLTAMAQSSTNMVKLLLDYHADANMETSVGTSWSLSPLAWAIFLGRPDLVELLLEGHADPNAMITSKLRETDAGNTLVENQERWTAHDRIHRGQATPLEQWEQNWPQPVPGITPLLWTTWGNPPKTAEIVKLLLDHGANPNVEDPRGFPPLAHLRFPLSDNGRQTQDLLIKAGADRDYNRRRGIWLSDDQGAAKIEMFRCPTNSINHYTLLEFLATLYQIYAPHAREDFKRQRAGRYNNPEGLVLFPDFARIVIHRLNGKSSEVLRVDVADILRSGECSKDVALQAGDLIEIPKQEHKVADKWWGLPEGDRMALDKCLLRTVRIVSQGHTNEVTLAPSLVDAETAMNGNWNHVDSRPLDAQALQGRNAGTLVESFLLNSVVRDDNVLLNTWDLAKVRLVRGHVKTVFDLTAHPPPEAWLKDGDVIEIPELGEGAPTTEAKETPGTTGLH